MSTEDLNAQQSDMSLYWNLQRIKFLLNRIQKNLNLIDTPPNAKSITVIGGNLFQIASEQYGDASQWALIAEANGLVDPEIKGVVTLYIPPLNNQDTGGIVK